MHDLWLLVNVTGYVSATAPASQAPPVATQPRNGLGVAALVCGIVGVVIGLIPLLAVPALALGILAIVFGAVGIRRVGRGEANNRGMAITGLITGLIALALAIYGFTVVNSAVNSLNDDLNNANTSSGAASFQSAQQRADRQEHHLIHQGYFITNQ